jgi:hypothetical protein
MLIQTQKPPVGTPLDRTAPLLNGLLWYSPGWENGGNQAADMIGGNGLTLASGTVWTPGTSPRTGGGIGCLTADQGALSGPWTIAYRPSQGPWTFVVGLSWTGATHGSFGEIFGVSSSNNGEANSVPLKIQWSGSSNFFRAVSGSSALAAGSTAITANTLIVLVVTANSSGSMMYANGILAGTGTVLQLANWGSGSGVWCGSSDPSGSTSAALASQIRFHFGAVYNRVLSAGEAMAWYQNPWRLFATPPPLAALVNAGTFSAESFTAGTLTILGNIPTGQPVALTGVGTSWNSSTTFSVSGLAGTSLASHVVHSATSATLVINTGATTGSLRISDGTTSTTISVITRAKPKWFPGLNRHSQRCRY